MTKVSCNFISDYIAPIAVNNWRIFHGKNLDNSDQTELIIEQDGFHMEIPVHSIDIQSGTATFKPDTVVRWNTLPSKKIDTPDIPDFEQILGFDPHALKFPITLVLGNINPEAKKQALTCLETSRALGNLIQRTRTDAYNIIAEKFYVPVA